MKPKTCLDVVADNLKQRARDGCDAINYFMKGVFKLRIGCWADTRTDLDVAGWDAFQGCWVD